MSEIIVHKMTGEIRKFPHESRPGGSYSNSIRYEGAFVIIKDVWGKETIFPAAEIKEIIQIPMRQHFLP